MPTYQYRCTECGHAFEEFQSFTDDALTVCSVCGGRLRKVFNAVGVVFKGSGFYRTDSRGSTAAASDSTPGESKSSDSKKESAAATTKTESATSTATPSTTSS